MPRLTSASVCSGLLFCSVAFGQLDADFDRPGHSTATLPLTLLPHLKKDIERDFDRADLDDCLKQQNRSLEQSVQVSRQMLGPDQHEAWLVLGYGFCIAGATNGPFLLYDKLGERWRTLLSTSGERLHQLKATMRGWPDLELSVHNSASSTTRYVYQFSGVRYVPISCVVTSIPLEEIIGNHPHPKQVREQCDWDWHKQRD